VLHAPGREILTLLPGGHYDFASGDSIATAQVTGVVALLLAQKPDLTAAAVSKLLRETSSTPQALAKGADQVDACAAVTALIGRGSCQSSAVRVGGGSREPSQRVALH
jgi:subtilisin family serine protease